MNGILIARLVFFHCHFGTLANDSMQLIFGVCLTLSCSCVSPKVVVKKFAKTF